MQKVSGALNLAVLSGRSLFFPIPRQGIPAPEEGPQRRAHILRLGKVLVCEQSTRRFRHVPSGTNGSNTTADGVSTYRGVCFSPPRLSFMGALGLASVCLCRTGTDAQAGGRRTYLLITEHSKPFSSKR